MARAKAARDKAAQPRRTGSSTESQPGGPQMPEHERVAGSDPAKETTELMRVLLAEDDVDMLDVTMYALRKYGFTVTGVTDGASALERWQAEQPDLVLLDVNLPTLNGMEVCKRIREQAATPVIMVTALGDEAH